MKDAKGALVADVVKDGPAEEAGIQVGDVIVEFDGKPVKDSAELPLLVARTPVGKSVKLKVLRGSAESILDVKIAELKDEEVEVASARRERGPRPRGAERHAGARREPRPRLGDQGRRRIQVKPGSAADDAHCGAATSSSRSTASP